MTSASLATPSTRVALVTGGTRGIGRAVVAALVADGWSVAFTYRDNVEAAREVASAYTDRAIAFALDLLDRARPDALVRDIEANMGPIEGLVNNAGVRFDALLAMTPDVEWDAVMETNAAGAFRCCRAVLPRMMSRRRGSIVNVSSLSAVSGWAGQTVYAASKASLIGLTRSLAREVGKRRIRVNAVVPGHVATDMTAQMSEVTRQAMRARECLPDGTSVHDVADMVAFLLSARSKAVTGQVIAVDAGGSA